MFGLSFDLKHFTLKPGIRRLSLVWGGGGGFVLRYLSLLALRLCTDFQDDQRFAGFPGYGANLKNWNKRS